MLAAFLLYLRQFFEPMQEISQFYNTFQSAGGRAGEALRACWRSSRPCRAARSPWPLADGHAARSSFDACGSPTVDGPAGAARARPDDPGRADRRAGRRDRRGQDDAGASWSPASTTRSRAAVPLDGVDLRDLAEADAAPGGGHGDPGELPVQRHGRRQHRVRPARRHRARGRRGRPGDRRARRSSPRCPTATTPTSASAAAGCRPGSVSWWRSPGRSSPIPRC